jgi:hypothetical protein
MNQFLKNICSVGAPASRGLGSVSRRIVFAVITAIAVSLAAPPPAQAQVTNVATISMTNLPSVVTGAAISNITSKVLVRKGRGIGITPYYSGTNVDTTGSFVLDFAPSVDGTSVPTTNFISVTSYANGTTAVRGWTNFNPNLLDNFQYLHLVRIVNNSAGATNRVFLTNVVVSYSN